jgi:hypothetical protein
VHPDGCMVETYDQMARHCGVSFVNGRGFEAWGANWGAPGLNGRGTACTSLAPHQRSQPVACVSQATMAWKSSGVRVP